VVAVVVAPRVAHLGIGWVSNAIQWSCGHRDWVLRAEAIVFGAIRVFHIIAVGIAVLNSDSRVN